MRLTADEKKLCPHLHRYLRDAMPHCATISVIVNNLVKYGGFKTVADAQHVLRWGNGPLVYTQTPTSNRRCANAFGHAKCAFESSYPDFIEIDLGDYNEFANGRGTGFTAGGQPVPIVGVAVLHALCHWGNFRNGVAETSERGIEFEKATYGRVVG
jgi:hypothetical protein